MSFCGKFSTNLWIYWISEILDITFILSLFFFLRSCTLKNNDLNHKWKNLLKNWLDVTWVLIWFVPEFELDFFMNKNERFFTFYFLIIYFLILDILNHKAWHLKLWWSIDNFIWRCFKETEDSLRKFKDALKLVKKVLSLLPKSLGNFEECLKIFKEVLNLQHDFLPPFIFLNCLLSPHLGYLISCYRL